jgi:hypothetical protein
MVNLESSDTPTSPSIPGQRQRCGGQIAEQLMFAERALQLVGAVVARRDGKGGALFPLMATSGNPYGFVWRLEPAAGVPDFKFLPLFPKGAERPPFSLLQPYGLATSGPIANEYGKKLTQQAELNYRNDCQRRSPRKGDEDLWDIWQPSSP